MTIWQRKKTSFSAIQKGMPGSSGSLTILSYVQPLSLIKYTTLQSNNRLSPMSDELTTYKEEVKSKKKLKKLYSKINSKPPVYKTVEDMMVMVRQYVNDGCKTKLVKVGKAPNTFAIEVKILTLMGIVLHLGFTSRKQMYNYSATNPAYSEAIAYAKTLITQYYEEKMQEGVSPTAMIFMLHNLDGLSMKNDEDPGDASKAIPQLQFTRQDNDKKIRQMNGGR